MSFTASASLLLALVSAPVDRSAEPVLRDILNSVGRLRNVHVVISTQARDNATMPFYPGYMADLWLEQGNRFRLQFGDAWGDNRLYVSDGKSLLIDPQDGSGWVTVRKPVKRVDGADSDLGSRGGHGSPFYVMLEGKSALGKLVAQDGFIKSAAAADGMSALQLQSKEFGLMTVYYTPGKSPLPLRIEYDNLPYLKQMNAQYPDWFPVPDAPLTQVDLTYVTIGQPLPSELFSTSPSRDLHVQDLRKGHW